MKRHFLTFLLLFTTLFAHANKNDNIPVATFGGGNFWYMQLELDKTWGVMHSKAGYSGGVTVYPTYEQVATGVTKHVETVQIVYDPGLISYEELLNIYFQNIDPTDADGQFCYRGSQYKPIIFYHTDKQRKSAESQLRLIRARFKGEEVVVQVLPYTFFYPAEESYQLYAKRRPFFYTFMEWRCGRKKKLKKIWGK